MRLKEKEEELQRSVEARKVQGVSPARERAEQDLIEAKERIGDILESITDAFFVLDKDWRFTYVNRCAQEILNPLRNSTGSLLGKNLWTEFPTLKESGFEEHFRHAARTERTVCFENFSAWLDQWLEVRVYAGAEGLSVYFHDVTERYRADAASRRTEERLRATFHQAAVGMAVAGLDGRFEQVNARFCNILGYPAEELLTKHFTDLTHPLDIAATQEQIGKLLDGQVETAVYEKRYLRKTGELVWSLTSLTLLKDTQGRPDKLIGVVEDITDRKRAEEIARASAHRLQVALAAGNLGDWSWDLATDLVTLGAQASQIFGLNGRTSISWSELRLMLLPEDREGVDQASRKAVEEQSTYGMEYRVLRQGKIVWVAARGRTVIGADRSVTEMVGVVQDITARKEAEEIRSRLAAVVESSDDAIISLSLDTIITTWNKGAERTFGYTREEAIGESVAMLIPTGSEDEEPAIIRRLLAGERIDHYETIRRRKDGTLLNVSLTVSPIYDASGTIVGASKISRDITDRKKAEEALREQTRLLELLNKTGRAIASQLDLETVVQTVTDSATELTGAKFGAFFYNVRTEKGESFLLYSLSGASKETFEKIGQPRATPLFGPTFRGEAAVRLDDVTEDPRYGQTGPHFGMPPGHLPVRSYMAVPVISRTGEVLGGLFFGHPERGVFTDRAERIVVGVAAQAAIAIDNARLYDGAQRELDQRKKVEQALREAQDELRRHAERLEDEVADRTARLRETIQELEAFSYSVSHDMRSPLRAMQGYAEALLEDYKGRLDPTAEDYLKRIGRAAKRMDLLVQDVLAYSRVAKGDIQLGSVNVENVILDVVQNYPALQPDRATIRIHSPIPPVLGHEAYLTQVISNFLSNAVKFVASGTRPVIDIRARTEGSMVRLSFQDNGIGIAAEHQSQIFQIFGRVYSEKKFEGTGIGLAIAKKAAERMGGSVGVASEFGRGSEFYVLLKKAP